MSGKEEIISIDQVIDWDEALEQCGGDEEFLKELLNDLSEELAEQLRKLRLSMVSATANFWPIGRWICMPRKITAPDLFHVNLHFVRWPLVVCPPRISRILVYFLAMRIVISVPDLSFSPSNFPPFDSGSKCSEVS